MLGRKLSRWIAAFLGCCFEALLSSPSTKPFVELRAGLSREVNRKLLIRAKAHRVWSRHPVHRVAFAITVRNTSLSYPYAPLTRQERQDTLEILFTSGTTPSPAV